MRNNQQSSYAAAEFIINYKLFLLRLIGNTSNFINFSMPTVKGVSEEDLLKILNSKFPSLKSVRFEYIDKPTANGTTIVYIEK